MPMNIEGYMDLFVHRRDVFAEQQASGAYFPVKRDLTEDDVAEHLAGFASYGVYVIDPYSIGGGNAGVPLMSNHVKYVVFDLDTEDPEALTHLKYCVGKLVDSVASGELPDANLHCLLLERSGRKGWHVWLLLDSPLPARQVRAWVSEGFNTRWVKVGAFTGGAYPAPLEIFPKQDYVDEGGFGNLVKLPLGRHAVSGNWSEFVPVPGWASSIEDVVPLPAALVPESLATPESSRPLPGARGMDGVRGNGSGAGTQGTHTTPFPCVTKILEEGLGQGERDRGIFHLACYLYGHGIPQDLAEELCLRVDCTPPLAEREVRTKVRSAYKGRYQGARCGTDWLVDFCPGDCRQGWRVKPKTESRYSYLD